MELVDQVAPDCIRSVKACNPIGSASATEIVVFIEVSRGIIADCSRARPSHSITPVNEHCI